VRPAPRSGAALLVAVWLAAGASFAEEGARPGVIVAEARVVPFPLTLEGLGTARANESVEIRPQASERITAIRFEEGEVVEAGRVLVELESAEARADVASARAALAESESQLRRARELYETRALSASELQTRLTRRDADQAALDAAQARLSHTTVRAPFAGRLGLRHVSLGSLVTPATVITTLDDTNPIKLDFDVPETVLARLQTGLPVRAHSAAWPDEIFEGQVASLDTRVDPVTRMLTVRALVPNAAGRLRPGMFLAVQMQRSEVEALMVPEQALVPEQSRQFVLVVTPGGEVEQREVRTGRRRPGQVEVLDGLAPGEQVIAEGTQKARAGQRVEIVGRIDVQEAQTR